MTVKRDDYRGFTVHAHASACGDGQYSGEFEALPIELAGTSGTGFKGMTPHTSESESDAQWAAYEAAFAAIDQHFLAESRPDII